MSDEIELERALFTVKYLLEKRLGKTSDGGGQVEISVYSSGKVYVEACYPWDRSETITGDFSVSEKIGIAHGKLIDSGCVD